MDNVFINLGDMVSVGQDSVSVFDSNNIISTSDALVGPAGPPGPQGERGLPGRDGVDGQNATIAIGTTTTGDAGTNASVVNTGTSSAAVLNFTIPRGAQGIQGIQGEPGVAGVDGAAATITVGSVQTVASDYPATVINSGTSSVAVLDFEIPRGIQGQTGETGPAGRDGVDGQAATISVGTTTTGAAGTNASVVNAGTSSAAVLNFTIPRGDTGASGPEGPAGKGFVNFSTSEQDTGLTWTNGSKIYQMSFMDNMPSITQGTYGLKYFTLPATPSKVIKIEGGLRRTTGTLMWYPLNTAVIQNGVVNGYVETHMFGADIYVMSNNANVSGAEITLTIYYIK